MHAKCMGVKPSTKVLKKFNFKLLIANISGHLKRWRQHAEHKLLLFLTFRRLMSTIVDVPHR